MTTHLIYDCPERNEDLLYATHFWAPDEYLFIKKNKKKYLVLTNLELERGKKEATVNKILSFDEYWKKTKPPKKGGRPLLYDVFKTALSDLNIKSVTVPASASICLVEGLKKRGIKVTWKPDPFFPERVIKTPFEKKEMGKAQKFALQSMKLVENILADSKIRRNNLYYNGKILTAEKVHYLINSFLLERGYYCGDPIVASGNHGVDPHDRGSGPLKPHQAIVVDIFPRSIKSGYWGDFTRTFCRGKARPELKRQYLAVKEAQEMAIRMVKDGVNGFSIHSAVVDFFNQAGYTTGVKNGKVQGFITGTGHGLGLAIHENPRISGVKEILKKGMMVTVEPGLYYHNQGGVRIEDLVYVTKTGCDVLGGRYPKRLEIL
jgi:Xaa-Pro aminopeptidase